MTVRRPDVTLADRLALAILADGPAPGSTLALRVAARKDTVLREIRTDSRFECLGRGRGSKWRLAAGNRIEGAWEPLGTDPGAGLGKAIDPVLFDRLDAIERRLSKLEQVAGHVYASSRVTASTTVDAPA